MRKEAVAILDRLEKNLSKPWTGEELEIIMEAKKRGIGGISLEKSGLLPGRSMAAINWALVRCNEKK